MTRTIHPLRVLVSEAEPGDARIAVDELTAAGHEVVRCFEPGAPAFPCVALEDPSSCPLQGRPVDVALDVRKHPYTVPTRREEGVICALRHHVPVVVAGTKAVDQLGEFAAAIVATPYDVVDAVERAADAPLSPHTHLAGAALQEFAKVHGIRAPFVVKVVRRKGGLVVLIRDHEHLDSALRQMAAVRVIAAVRGFDRESIGIDVAFDDDR
ncbi:MAG: hypothetical protein ACT4OX_05685 [Actinomycetota bacterium]